METLPGFRKEHQARITNEMQSDMGFTRPEASATCAIDTLNNIALRNAIGNQDLAINAEIRRRADLIVDSKARKSAGRKLVAKIFGE